MALQMNIPLPGGIEHANGYVRVVDCRVCKKDDADDWFMMVDVAAYKDADARSEGKRLVTLAVDKFKFAYSVGDETGSNLVAHAYSKLKDVIIFSGASDV
jgi:hypothetical protein